MMWKDTDFAGQPFVQKYLGEAKKNLKNKTLFYDALERTFIQLFESQC